MKKYNIQEIWDNYLNNRDRNDLKEKLLLHYISLVRVIAGRMMISLPRSVSIDDLISNGIIGLIDALNKFGKIYPFIGIRGDAKELYKKVSSGEEKRISLIKTSSNEEQKRYICNW